MRDGATERRRRRRAAGALAAALLAVGCGGGDSAASAEANRTGNAAEAPQGAAADPAAAQAPVLQTHAEGLRLVPPSGGEGADIAFGTAQDQVLARLGFLGEPEVGTNAECGAGPMQIAQWPDGLSLLFQDGAFAGWSVDGRTGNRVATSQGVGIGSTRAEVDSAYPGTTVEESSLGHEFAAGGIGGLLDGTGPDARITAMWAGTTCMFR